MNNNVGASANFTNFDAAVASALVLNGDTLYLEASANSYSTTTLNKRLTIIGTGYFLSGADANTGLQANTNVARLGSALSWDSAATGSRFFGIQIDGDLWTDPRADSMVFERCRFLAAPAA
ncbi:MAG: hypothetical protein EAY75_15795 [Bacteroidetes bacterium]|nr:MAG: hypothetical protein EAY75_15795 [Bacteroidota bacterium]